MKLTVAIFIFFLPIILFSQNNTNENQYNYTENLAYAEDFSGAIRMYKQMINFDPKNPVFNYKLGFAYLNTFGKQDSAAIYLNKANKLYDDNYRADVSPFDIKFYLARAYRLQEKIDSSIIILETLKTEVKSDKYLMAINKELKSTRKSMNNLFSVSDLDSVINSTFSEHSPVFSNSENILIFTSRRYNSNSTSYDDGQYDEDIYYSKRLDGVWSSPKLMDEFSTPANEATSNLTPNGTHLLIYKDDANGSIYISHHKDNKWSEPEKLPRPINSRNRETHASLTPDGNQIFFTSNRRGGFGGLDIWTSFKMGNKWTDPINLGAAINSKGDEESPNISNDGQVLYFSSNGREGYGGFDIFKSEKTQFNTWGMAENLGYPINSIGDDIFFTPINQTDKAFYSSYRSDSKGNADIFVVYIDSSNVNKKTINIGYVYDKNKKPVDSTQVIIFNETTNKKYLAKPTKTGKFIFLTESNNKYTLKVKRKNKILFTDTFIMPDSVPQKVLYKKIILTEL